MIVEVLLSCMHLDEDDKVMELVRRTNIRGKAVVVSQCNRNGSSQIGDVKIIYTNERGLSSSRNLAIANSTADICLLCDDDEILCDNYQEIIEKAYAENSSSDFICFYVYRPAKPCPQKQYRISRKTFWPIASVEISFLREKVKDKGIHFDTRLGSGVSCCGGEENKFIYDLINSKLSGIYIPKTIGRLIPSESPTWFKGFSCEYFKDRANFSRILLGPVIGRIYSFYFLFSKRKLIKSAPESISMIRALWIMIS